MSWLESMGSKISWNMQRATNRNYRSTNRNYFELTGTNHLQTDWNRWKHARKSHPGQQIRWRCVPPSQWTPPNGPSHWYCYLQKECKRGLTFARTSSSLTQQTRSSVQASLSGPPPWYEDSFAGRLHACVDRVSTASIRRTAANHYRWQTHSIMWSLCTSVSRKGCWATTKRTSKASWFRTKNRMHSKNHETWTASTLWKDCTESYRIFFQANWLSLVAHIAAQQ